MPSNYIRQMAQRLIESGGLNTAALDLLTDELAQPKEVVIMATKTRKAAPVANFRKCGFGRGAASNWDAFGVPIKKGSKLEDGIYQVKNGEIRRMKDSNGTGTVCVVYRVAAKDKTAVAKPAAKVAAKKAPVKAAAKAPVKPVAKAPAKKAPVKVAPKAKGKK